MIHTQDNTTQHGKFSNSKVKIHSIQERKHITHTQTVQFSFGWRLIIWYFPLSFLDSPCLVLVRSPLDQHRRSGSPLGPPIPLSTVQLAPPNVWLHSPLGCPLGLSYSCLNTMALIAAIARLRSLSHRPPLPPNCNVPLWYTTSARNQGQSGEHNLIYHTTLRGRQFQRRNYVIYLSTAIDSQETAKSLPRLILLLLYNIGFTSIQYTPMNATRTPTLWCKPFIIERLI